MNRAFGLRSKLDFNDDPSFSVSAFLGLLDEIYTLNQDLLLETLYVPQPAPRRWLGPQFPGVKAPEGWTERDRGERILGAWIPDDEFALVQGLQPIFKLHGSVNWRESSGERLLVLGAANNERIGQSSLLKRYFDHFGASLMRGDERLLVIGYSFRDDHLNKAIMRASREAGLQVYIVDPRGLDVLRHDQGAQIRAPNELDDLRIAGISVRTVDAIFGAADSLQLESLLPFAAA